MSSIAPNSEIYLIKAPIESDNLNHLNFANRQAQLNYFTSLPKLSFEKYTYIRTDNAIQVEGNADDLMRYNYMLYKNTAYGNKWIFAFITNVEFLANDVSRITFKTDVFNTWYFDITFKASYVQREHTNDDTIGANILDEEVNGGEYVVNSAYEMPILDEEHGGFGYYIAIQCVDAPEPIKNWLKNYSRVYCGLQSGTWVIMLDSQEQDANTNLNKLIEWFDFYEKTSAIVAMYILPKNISSNVESERVYDTDHPEYSVHIYTIDDDSDEAFYLGSSTRDINTTIDGYSPKNNRLFCFPYNYLRVTNHSGQDAIYRWEEFKSTNHQARFQIFGIPNQGCDTRIVPKYYKFNASDSKVFYDLGLTGGKLPLISWKSDYYLNWQAQNGVNAVGHAGDYVRESSKDLNNYDLNNYNQNAGVMSEGGAASALDDFISAGGQFLGSLASSVGQFFSNIKNDLSGAGFRAYMTPDTLDGCANIGDLNFSAHMSSFGIESMSIKREMAIIIDNYFSMFGYKCLKTKIPNINGRRNWNFVQTRNCNIEGDIPQVDLAEIKAIFNNGVTIWHNPTTFLDYSQNNDII